MSKALIAPVFTLCAVLSAFALSACNQNAPTTDSNVHANANSPSDSLAGCYSVEKDTPAQIRINLTADQYSMQMKENTAAVWDDAEALNTLSVAAGWRYFDRNAINLGQQDIQAIIARPDEVMALAALKSGVSNLNPHIDSDYAIMIAGMVNTVYRVACDDVPLDLATPVNPHLPADDSQQNSH